METAESEDERCSNTIIGTGMKNKQDIHFSELRHRGIDSMDLDNFLPICLFCTRGGLNEVIEKPCDGTGIPSFRSRRSQCITQFNSPFVSDEPTFCDSSISIYKDYRKVLSVFGMKQRNIHFFLLCMNFIE